MRISDWSADVCSSDLVDVAATCEPVAEYCTRPGDAAQYRFQLRREFADSAQIRPRHLHTERTADAGREHVDARTDGIAPGIGQARQAYAAIEIADQTIEGL